MLGTQDKIHGGPAGGDDGPAGQPELLRLSCEPQPRPVTRERTCYQKPEIFFLNPVLLQSSVTLCVIFCIYFIKFHCLFFWYVQYANTCDLGHTFLYYCGMVGFGCWLTRGSCNIQTLCVQLHTSSDLSKIIMCTCSEYEFYLCILR